MSVFSVPFFCKVEREEKAESCGHEKCMGDPHFRVSDEALITLASWCSSKRIAIRAEVALRKRYPSQRAHKVKVEEPR